MSAQYASMDDPIDERLLVNIFAESFSERSVSSFGTAIFALPTRDNLTWESETARLLQVHVTQQVSKAANN